MQARMSNIAMIVPGFLQALHALGVADDRPCPNCARAGSMAAASALTCTLATSRSQGKQTSPTINVWNRLGLSTAQATRQVAGSVPGSAV